METTQSILLKCRGTSTSVWLAGTVFEIDTIEERSGLCVLEASGIDSKALFANEAGGHRWQGVSPTDKAGRVHTSTITVAVLDPDLPVDIELNERDIEVTTFRGSGPGGQNRNKRDTAVQVKHHSSGLVVRCETNRTQGKNREMAMALLSHRLKAKLDADRANARLVTKRSQVGCGARGDKRRTIREQHNEVVDHLTGKRWVFDRYVRGIW